jgi:hypothetical protein
MNRRNLLTGSATLATITAMPHGKAITANGTIPGAIRWDAWYGGGAGSSDGTVNQQVCNSLGPQHWHFRAPWFAAPSSTDTIVVDGNQQATMDAEIAYAASAGLRYWAYGWAGQQTPPSALMNAWNLHQSSGIKNTMNWCMLLPFSRSSTWKQNIPTYVSYFQQVNYQLVFANCPLLYVFVDDLTALRNIWGSSWSDVQAFFIALRTAAASAGLGSPYIVIMNGNRVNAASYATQTGADAISNYRSGTPGVARPWPTYEASIESYWAAMAATGTPIVPIAMTGWDPRPRAETPPTFARVQKPVNEASYVIAPTAEQLTAHLQAAVGYVESHPAQCPSKAILIYSWNECDEGGNAIIPTWTGGAPETSRITALQRVRW